MKSAAHFRRELASELSGEQGGDLQWSADLQVRVAELDAENKKLRRALKSLLDDKTTTYAVRAQRARAVLAATS